MPCSCVKSFNSHAEHIFDTILWNNSGISLRFPFCVLGEKRTSSKRCNVCMFTPVYMSTIFKSYIVSIKLYRVFGLALNITIHNGVYDMTLIISMQVCVRHVFLDLIFLALEYSFGFLT